VGDVLLPPLAILGDQARHGLLGKCRGVLLLAVGEVIYQAQVAQSSTIAA